VTSGHVISTNAISNIQSYTPNAAPIDIGKSWRYVDASRPHEIHHHSLNKYTQRLLHCLCTALCRGNVTDHTQSQSLCLTTHSHRDFASLVTLPLHCTMQRQCNRPHTVTETVTLPLHCTVQRQCNRPHTVTKTVTLPLHCTMQRQCNRPHTVTETCYLASTLHCAEAM